MTVLRPCWHWVLCLVVSAGCTAPVEPPAPDAGLPGPGAACSGTCATGSTCLKGTCYARTCPGEACTMDEVCASGRCVDARCVGLSCGSGGACVGGNCFALDCASAACADGEVCESEQCMERACVGVRCGAAERCRAGRCEVLPCTGSGCPDAGAGCPAGQVLENGVCVPASVEDGGTGDAGVSCPAGQALDAGACVQVEGVKTLGQACSAGTECVSGFCADGVCCDGACTGDCQGCTGANPGRCGPVAEGNAEPGCGTFRCGASGACLASCASPGDCQAGARCLGGACVAPGPDGSACATGLACASGHCVDGVCCNTACDGACDRCDLPGLAGTCTPAPGGSAGLPSCAPYACSGGSGCATGCTSAAGCAAGWGCVGGRCAALRALGEGCGVDAQCESGHCADGVCCGSACAGSCEACNQPGSVGTCVPHAAGEDPESECGGAWCDGSARCAGACEALGCKPGLACVAGACVGTQGPGAPCSSGVQCQSGFCTDGVCCESACSGTCQRCDVGGSEGTCAGAAGGTDPDGDCGGFLCGGGGACLVQCAARSDCKPGLSCVQGSCLAQFDDGLACGADRECGSGHCVDGVCCGGACAGTCEACNLPGRLGTCSAITAGADPAGECGAAYCGGNRACATACATAAACKPGTSCVGGTCDGKLPNGTACSTSAHCQGGLCVDGVCCDAACGGACQSCAVPGKEGTCSAFAPGTDPASECGASFCSGAASCLASCAADGDCKGGFACVAGTCRQVLVNGAACTRDGECASAHCADGVCCGTACGGACDACVQPGSLGVCRPIAAQSAGTPACAPYLCNGALATCPGSCTTESDCTDGLACLGGACVQKLAQGSGCARTAQCAAGQCVDGVCCSTACTGTCQACNAGTPGSCTALPPGTDPDGECAGDTTCNGAGACLKAAGAACGASAECQSGACVDGVCCTSACGGACRACTGPGGTCVNVAAGTDPASECGRYQCAAGACASTCARDADCKAGFRCAGNACVPPGQVGDPCSSGLECQSGQCADGVCCDSPCTGTCESCAQAGKAGICTAHAAGTDPEGNCAASTCSGQSSCAPAGGGSCALDADCGAGKFCAEGSCVARYANGGACDGTPAHCASGTCADGVCCDGACAGTCEACNVQGAAGACTPVPSGTDPGGECGAGYCSGSAASCAASCVVNAECKPGMACVQGVCTGKLAVGGTCQRGDQCDSGFCVDGTCCSTACSGRCESCALPGAPGTCGPVAAGKDPSGECGVTWCDGASGCLVGCSGDADCKSGYACVEGSCRAKLSAGAACTREGECASNACVDGVCCREACRGACDSCAVPGKLGTCSPAPGPGSPACAPFACSGLSSTCPTACVTEAECEPGRACVAGACVDKLPAGSACARSTQCADDGASDGVGHCVDGVCCDTACGGACEACDVPSAVGTCTPAGPLADPDGACGLYYCDGQVGACASACEGATGTGCKPDFRCEAATNRCVPKLAAGAACGNPSDCATGLCVDGVCCGGACDGVCEQCNRAGLEGTCFPAAAGTDPDGDCAANSSVCSGRREIPGVQEACAPVGSTSCALDEDCAAGLFCAPAGNLCVALLPNGTPCDAVEAHCGSGACADGVCCDAACAGACEACNLGAATGTCTPVPAGQDPESECGLGFCGGGGGCGACALDADCKPGAYCNGGTCTAESPVGAGCLTDEACGTGFCTDGVCCADRCDGPCRSCAVPGQPGVCTGLAAGAADPQCGGFLCGASGACATGCAVEGDCAPGRACVEGACVAGLGNGAACGADADCASGACVAVPGGGKVCCESRCETLCSACNAAGTCAPVAAGTDPANDCAGAACDGQGNCQQGLIQFGSACAQAADCASGFCVDGYCCESACSGTCESCDQAGAEGLCLAHPAGTDPESECGGYQCEGRRCSTSCTGDVQCKDSCNQGVCGAPRVQYAYGAWSPWSGCGAGDVQETRTRECIENGAASVGCELCVAALGGGGCTDSAACPGPGSGGGGGACTPLNYNVCVQSLADCQAALSTRQNECLATGCGQWTVTTSCRVGGSPSNPNCWGAQAACGAVQQPACEPVNYNVCTMVGQADCQSTLEQLRTRCLSSGCNSFYAAPCTIGGSPSNAFCWGAQAECGLNLAPPPVCSWSQAGFHALTSQPPGSWFRHGGINGQGPAVVGGRVAWLQTSDWNHLYVPSSLTAADDVVAVSVDVFLPQDVVTAYFGLGVMSMSAGYDDLLGGVDYYFERPTQTMRAITRPPFSTQDSCCTGPTETLMVAGSPTPFAAEWHRLRVEFSRQRSKARFFVDGNLVGTGAGNISWMYDPIRLDGVNSLLFNPANVAWSNIMIERGTSACLP